NTGRTTVREFVRGIPVTRVGSFGRMLSADLSPGLVRELSRPFDILHLHVPHPVGMLAYLVAKTPAHSLVVTHHSDIVKQARYRAVLGPLFPSVMQRADAIVATSDRYVASSAEIAPYRSKVRVIPYGIDLASFSPELSQDPRARKLRAQYRSPVLLAV